MAGDLRQQRPGHPFDTEGEARVFDRALVADFRQHIDERGGFLIRQFVHDLIDAGRGIAKTGRTGYGPFRIRGIGQQGHMHLLALLCIQIRVRHTSVSANYISNSIADCPSRFNPYSPAVSPGTGAPVPLRQSQRRLHLQNQEPGYLNSSSNPERLYKKQGFALRNPAKITYWEYPKPFSKS